MKPGDRVPYFIEIRNILVFVLIMLYLILLAMWYKYHNEIDIVPDRMVEKYLQFIGSLTIAVITFIAVYLYYVPSEQHKQRKHDLMDAAQQIIKLSNIIETIQNELCDYINEPGSNDRRTVMLDKAFSECSIMCDTLASYRKYIDKRQGVWLCNDIDAVRLLNEMVKEYANSSSKRHYYELWIERIGELRNWANNFMLALENESQ